MRNVKMKYKVIFGIVVIVFINILLGFITTIINRDIQNKNALVINEMSVIHSLKDGYIYHINWSSDLNELVVYSSSFNWELDPYRCEFGMWITDYMESDDYKNIPGDIRQQLSNINQSHLELHRVTQEAIEYYNQGDKKAALKSSDNAVKNNLNFLLDAVEKTEKSILRQVDINKNDIEKLTKNINVFSLLTVIISLITAATIIIILINETIKPLSELINKIKLMNQDEVYQEVDGIHSSIEMGNLLYVFNHMIHKVNTQQIKLQEQYEELLAQGEEVSAQNEELSAQGDELSAQNQKILEQQKVMKETISQLKVQEDQLNKLYLFSKSLTETSDLNELIKTIIGKLLDKVNAQVGVLFLYNQGAELLEVKYTSGLSGSTDLSSLSLGEGLAGRAALQRKPVVVNYESGQLNSQGLNGEVKMTYEFYQPLVLQERLLGVIALGRLGDCQFTTADQELLASLAAQISIALDNTSNYQQTQEALIKIQELDKLKSEMINTVSHELRTPLASIIGFTELMLRKSPDEVKAKKYLATIYKEAERLKLLINDFLDLQKIETGRFEISKNQVNLKELIQDCISLYEGQGHENHPITLRVDEALPMVLTDPDKVSQVIGNLLSNAIKYSPNGGPIHVSASHYNSSRLIISVKDCGLGIPDDAQKKLFQPFYRVDNSDRREIGGTGLGLAICYKIIKGLGGDIWVESMHGKGSTFSFTLPSSDKTGKTEEVPIAREKDRNNENNMILIVEDDKSLSSLLKEALMDEGYETIVYDNGPSTLAFLEHHVPQAIILDLILLGPLDGWEILRWLKGNENTKNIPVIISSCIDQNSRMKEYHVADYFVKPFPPEKLVKSIDTIIQAKGGSV